MPSGGRATYHGGCFKPRIYELPFCPIEKQERNFREESGTHVIGVDTFIDLPKKAFTKNPIQDHISPCDAILWAWADGESG